MTRSILAALAAAALFASASFAGTPSEPSSERELRSSPRYANTAERWQGRPALRASYASPLHEESGSEKVYELVPSVNFLVEGQNPGGFQIPRF